MKINDAGLQLVMRWEGLRLKAYLCPAGVPTIGYGHTGDVTHDDVMNGKWITEHQADVILQHDMERFEGAVEKAVKVPINENQFSALVAFAFNCKGWERSTLLKYVNKGQFKNAANEFGKWVHAEDPKTKKMVVLPGLVKRRAAERELFNREVIRA